MKINGIDTSKGGTINSMIERLYWMGYDITKADAPNANFECYEAKITDKSGYNTITIFFGGCDAAHITARVDKINGSHKWYYGKTLAQMLAVVRQCMYGYEFEAHTEEPKDEVKEEEETMETKTTTTTENEKEETTMKYEERKAIAMEAYKAGKIAQDVMGQIMLDNLSDEIIEREHEDGSLSDEIYNALMNNKKEDTTMKTTTKPNQFTFEGHTYYTNDKGTYFYCIKAGNTKADRIPKAIYEEAKELMDAEQAKLDAEPSRIEVNSDLHEPAVLNEFGCVDCSKCNVTGCVHRDCMRRNPRSEGGLGECPRLDVKPIIIDEGVVDTELEEIINETGLEPADAELERNIRKEKKASKPRRSKDIAYEAHGITLTAKQVDFIKHLPDTCYWEHGLDSCIWVDCLCDEIGGQFEDKPMTVGAMISTLCEKGLGYRTRDTSRKGKPTTFELTEMGKKVAGDLGLA